MLAELGTSGSVDGNSQLIIKGRFQQKQIENVLRRYIKEYVTCHTCRSPDTILQKDTRLFFLQCETCGSRCSVASIKSGFQVRLLCAYLIKHKEILISYFIIMYCVVYSRLSQENVLLFEQKLPKEFLIFSTDHKFFFKIYLSLLISKDHIPLIYYIST